MSKTPEQRAARIAPIGTIKNEVVAKLIRAAENAALERAARLIEARHFGQCWRDGYGVNAHDLIRSLKSKAPRARSKR